MKLQTGVGENPKLMSKVMADGNLSLFLDYYLGRVSVYDEAKDKMVSKVRRRRQALKLTIIARPRTQAEKEQNRETLEIAKKIRFAREKELLEREEGYSIMPKKINYLDFMQSYIDKYTKKDKRMMVMAFNRFKDFLNETPEYKCFNSYIKPQQLTRAMMLDFTEYLQSRGKGEGPKDVFERFKKMARYAVNEENVQLPQNLFYHVTIKVDRNRLTKDFLSPEEEERLICTHYDHENTNIRNAFIFCLYTGLRWCDVKDLKFENFDLSNRILRYEQNKTKGHSSHSGVSIPLSDEAIALIGEGKKDDIVFPLPSYTMCSKALKRWSKRAGIDKHITWHCARHSFGTNMAAAVAKEGISIRVVQDLMGHSSLKYTEIYTRVVDEQKREAIDGLSRLMEKRRKEDVKDEL